MNNNKGFSILEVVVAITLLLIMAFALSSLFTTGFSGIFTSGRKSEALYKLQQDMENAIINYNNGNSNKLTISFPSRNEPLEIEGRYIECKQNYTGRNGEQQEITLFSFVPKKR